jgi:SAM-dependent methyltransferase
MTHRPYLLRMKHTAALCIVALALLVATACTKSEPAAAPQSPQSSVVSLNAPEPEPGQMRWDPARGIIPSSIYNAHPEFSTEQMALVKQMVREHAAAGRDPRALFRGDSIGLDFAEHAPLKAGDVVADIGAGTGGLEVSLLAQKTPFAKLYAVDIDAAALDVLRFVLEETKLPGREKVVAVNNTLSDLKLPAGAIDVMILLNTPLYTRPGASPEATPDPGARATLTQMAAALRPGGVLHVFEREEIFNGAPEQAFATIVGPFAAVGLEPVLQERLRINNPHFHVRFTKPR